LRFVYLSYVCQCAISSFFAIMFFSCDLVFHYLMFFLLLFFSPTRPFFCCFILCVCVCARACVCVCFHCFACRSLGLLFFLLFNSFFSHFLFLHLVCVPCSSLPFYMSSHRLLFFRALSPYKSFFGDFLCYNVL
jgi:hypothetical protein